MKLLLDMNLSPSWVQFLANAKIEAVHWSTIGVHSATDAEIFQHAASHGLIIVTNDLDFGSILAHTHQTGPSVVQVRTQDPTPNAVGTLVLQALTQFQMELKAGAILTILLKGPKVRLLPLAQR